MIDPPWPMQKIDRDVRHLFIWHAADALGTYDDSRIKAELAEKIFEITVWHMVIFSGWPRLPPLHLRQRLAQLPPRRHPGFIDRPHVLDAVAARSHRSRDGHRRGRAAPYSARMHIDRAETAGHRSGTPAGFRRLVAGRFPQRSFWPALRRWNWKG